MFLVFEKNNLKPSPLSTVTSKTYEKEISNLKKDPNIFYIIPDGLASPRVLRDYADIDTKVYLNNLRAKDFSISDHSYSNYNVTYLSLATLFNMRTIVTDKSEKYNNRLEFYPNIREKNPTLIRFLKSKNYKFIIIPPTWGGCPIDKQYIV